MTNAIERAIEYIELTIMREVEKSGSYDPRAKMLINKLKYHQKTHISIARDDVAEYFVEPYGSYPPSQSDLESVFLLVQNKMKEG
tara:strand:+ start:161 stop:415 length:255 start_codon:yes stop_codon:yes gene_type:complete